VSDWERFAAEDPEFYICTEMGRAPHTSAQRQMFFAEGEEATSRLLRQVEDELPGWSLAIEIGCGIGRLLVPHSRRFSEVRGVDVSPTMLAGARAVAEEQGQHNVRTYLPHEAWDVPPANADYVYSYLVFQHITEPRAIAEYATRTARALRKGGIAQLQFDTRPATVGYLLRERLPDVLLPRTQRRGIRRIRRDAEWVRRLITGAGLEILSERDAQTSKHWFVARRRAAS
jgi:SAM-dependent methyltransferase